jgi:hypothetical protein
MNVLNVSSEIMNYSITLINILKFHHYYESQEEYLLAFLLWDFHCST